MRVLSFLGDENAGGLEQRARAAKVGIFSDEQ
jgi:hypothetical protein